MFGKMTRGWARVKHGVVQLGRRVGAILTVRFLIEAVVTIIVLHRTMRHRMHQGGDDGMDQRFR